jgi:hypothetical protein
MRKNLGLQQFYEKGFNEDIEKLIKDNEIIF